MEFITETKIPDRLNAYIMGDMSRHAQYLIGELEEHKKRSLIWHDRIKDYEEQLRNVKDDVETLISLGFRPVEPEETEVD
jgi:hypothetical protein